MLFRKCLIFNILNSTLGVKNPYKLMLVCSIRSRNFPSGSTITLMGLGVAEFSVITTLNYIQSSKLKRHSLYRVNLLLYVKIPRKCID